MQTQVIKTTVIKRMIKDGGRRSSPAFIDALNAHVLSKLEKAITYHNGGKKTLDLDIAAYVGITR